MLFAFKLFAYSLFVCVFYFPVAFSAGQYNLSFEDAFPADIPKIDNTRSDSKISDLRAYYFKGYRIDDDPVINIQLIDNVVEPYLGRTLLQSELVNLINNVTTLYIEHGYINSGVVYDINNSSNEILALRVVRGQISDIHINNNRTIDDAYFYQHLTLGDDEVFNLFDLEKKLRKVNDTAAIKSLKADFQPGRQLGEGVLYLNVEENKPYAASLSVNNYGFSNTGENQLLFQFNHYNVSRYADEVNALYSRSEDKESYVASYQRGIFDLQSRLNVRFLQSQSKYNFGGLDEIDISSSLRNFQLGIERFFSGNNKQHIVSVQLDWIKSKALLNNIFPIQSIADQNGVSNTAALRLDYLWRYRSINNAFELGIGASYGESVGPGNRELGDKNFNGVHLHSQWASRFARTQFMVKLKGRKSDSVLFASELAGIGGHNNLRGYTEGELVAADSVYASMEWRYLYGLDAFAFQNSYIGLFFDTARLGGDIGFQERQVYNSYGLSFTLQKADRYTAKIDWARRLDGEEPGSSLQKQGVHMSLSYLF